MPSAPHTWGFQPVLDFMESDTTLGSQPYHRPPKEEGNETPVAHLGSFEKLFERLGISVDDPTSVVNVPSIVDSSPATEAPPLEAGNQSSADDASPPTPPLAALSPKKKDTKVKVDVLKELGALPKLEDPYANLTKKQRSNARKRAKEARKSDELAAEQYEKEESQKAELRARLEVVQSEESLNKPRPNVAAKIVKLGQINEQTNAATDPKSRLPAPSVSPTPHVPVHVIQPEPRTPSTPAPKQIDIDTPTPQPMRTPGSALANLDAALKNQFPSSPHTPYVSLLPVGYGNQPKSDPVLSASPISKPVSTVILPKTNGDAIISTPIPWPSLLAPLTPGFVPKTVSASPISEPVGTVAIPRTSSDAIVSTPLAPNPLAPGLVPRTVQPVLTRMTSSKKKNKKNQSPTKVPDPVKTTIIQPVPATGPAKSPTTLALRSPEDRYFDFQKALLHNFPEDKKHLLSGMDRISEEGIHVFIDASNILIGFREMLKRSRHGRFDMSFDRLAQLLERRRPVAKRVYAGSTRISAPNVSDKKLHDLAGEIGYEKNIYEQVYKVKELSDSQKFFKDVEIMGWAKATEIRSGTAAAVAAGGPGSQGSDSETGASPTASPDAPVLKWAEQGVDEGLQHKMCWSIIKYKTPTTMVLATGDGNKAEYSEGFLAHVEAVLEAGWKVELVSWRQQTSSGYRNRGFRAKWGERFRIIELDDYLEYLIDA